MSSPSQIDILNVLVSMPEDQLARTLSKVKSLRETEELRARLPAQLAPFASNITIVQPIKTFSTPPERDVHWGSFQSEQRSIHMSVAVVPPPDSQSQVSGKPHTKPLVLLWQDSEAWRGEEMSGSADYQMHSISLQYGPSQAKAFTGWYEDPGKSLPEFSHNGIKSVVEEVVRDMGFREGELGNSLEVIEALLGDDGRRLLDRHAEDGTTLRGIIKEELDDGIPENHRSCWENGCACRKRVRRGANARGARR